MQLFFLVLVVPLPKSYAHYYRSNNPQCQQISNLESDDIISRMYQVQKSLSKNQPRVRNIASSYLWDYSHKHIDNECRSSLGESYNNKQCYIN